MKVHFVSFFLYVSDMNEPGGMNNTNLQWYSDLTFVFVFSFEYKFLLGFEDFWLLKKCNGAVSPKFFVLI